MEYNDEDCQTEGVATYSREVQVDFKPQMVDMGTDPDLEILEAAEKELFKRIEEKLKLKMPAAKPTKVTPQKKGPPKLGLSLELPQDSSGCQQSEDGEGPKAP